MHSPHPLTPHPAPLAALQPLRRGCHGNERGRFPFASRDARRQRSSARPWPRCRAAAEILIRANCQEATPNPPCRARQLPAQRRPQPTACPPRHRAVPGGAGSPGVPKADPHRGPAVAEHHWGWSPAPPKCRQTPSHRTDGKLIYSPHLKEVIKLKGRSYLFFCYASSKLSNSQIKSRKRLMKDAGLLRGWADAAGPTPGRGEGGRRQPHSSACRGFSGRRCSERNLCLIGRQIWAKQSGGSGGAPRQTAPQFKQPFASQRHPRTTTGLPQPQHHRCALGAAGGGHRRCRAGTGRRQRCSRSPVHYSRKSAIFAGEEFFLIGPRGDIRAIFKEV